MSESPGLAASRLDKARNVWVATVRPDGRPHLVPIWFVVDAGRWYICTAPGSVKARNLEANPQAALALEDGDQPYVVEGRARPVPPTASVVARFKAKYDWDITGDAQYSQLLEITVARQVLGG
jgi:PPOX class probable F420-dependent enzyme